MCILRCHSFFIRQCLLFPWLELDFDINSRFSFIGYHLNEFNLTHEKMNHFLTIFDCLRFEKDIYIIKLRYRRARMTKAHYAIQNILSVGVLMPFKES